MQTAVIIDGILVLILALCTVLGWRRGAFKSVIGIIVVVAALVGAVVISNQATPVVIKGITPMISEQIELRFATYAQEHIPTSAPASQGDAEGLFSAMGLYQGTAEKLAQDVMEQVHATGQAIVQTAVESMIESIVHAVLFLVSFVVLLIALKIFSRIFGLLTSVPGIHLMDAVGGGVFGLIQGSLILFALVWAVQFFGSGVPEGVVQQTVLFRFFATLNPISMVSGL